MKLLRTLHEGEGCRRGGKQAKKVDVRIIAATNRNLLEQVSSGRFRADFLYRLAVAAIKLPPLREREGDVSLLLDRLLEQVNNESVSDPGYMNKVLSPGARKLMLRHSWPGAAKAQLKVAIEWSCEALERVNGLIPPALFNHRPLWTGGNTNRRDTS